MNNYFIKILEIYNETYSFNSLNFLLASPQGLFINYYARVEIKNASGTIITPTVSVNSVQVLDTTTGGRYSLEYDPVATLDLNTYKIKFKTSSETGESANISKLAIELTVNGAKVFIERNISVYPLEVSNKIFTYKGTTPTISDSNLLLKRLGLGFPLWSTVNKNYISNTSKIVSPLFSIFSKTISLVNEWYRCNFKSNYDTTLNEFERVYLKNYVQSVYRINSDNTEDELIETSDVFLSHKKIKNEVLLPSFNLNKKLISVEIDGLKDNISHIEYINNNLISTCIYVRGNIKTSNRSISTRVIIKGIDASKEFTEEVLNLQYGEYYKILTKFTKILSIESNSIVELTNYIDLRYNHNVNQTVYNLTPIAGKNFSLFSPHVRIKPNEERTIDVLHLTDNGDLTGNNGIYFSSGAKINSLYMDNEFNVITLVEKDNKQLLRYSKLSLDLSKNTNSDITLNNNNVISVSNVNTHVEDWVDVTVNIEELKNRYGVKSFYIKIQNKDLIYYYAFEVNALSPIKQYLYADMINVDLIEFTIFVENSDSFIFTVCDDITKNYFSSMTESPVLDTFYEYEVSTSMEEVAATHLILYDDDIYINKESPETLVNPESLGQESNKLSIVFQDKYVRNNNFLIKLNEDYIDKSSSSLNEKYYKVVEYKGTTIVEFDVRKLKYLYGTEFMVQIGKSYSTLTNILPIPGTATENLYLAPSSSISILYEGLEIDSRVLNPLYLETPINDYEIYFTVNTLTLPSITVMENLDYGS